MLVLSRKTGEKIVIDNRITIVVNRISGNRVTLGIEAPSSVHILRGELEAIVSEFRDDESKGDDGPISFSMRSAVG
ncbi:MAG: carbon storage regulator [Pirellulaceae bacterium]|jgi:carbon storage regulator CsrA|nr:carbon storage regulator [Planctomycetaceae bacterium]HIM28263.1 carbon storage regulator [Planctomycetota bacterium]